MRKTRGLLFRKNRRGGGTGGCHLDVRWIDPAEAMRKGATPEEYSKKVAKTWKEGLATWDQDGERIRRMKENADFTITRREAPRVGL